MRENVLTFLFNVVCTIFFGLLFFYSLTMTGYVPLDLSTELISFRPDNFLLNCLWLFVAILSLFGLYLFVDKVKHRINTRAIALGSAIYAMIAGAFWAIEGNVEPEADQGNLGFYAEMFNIGNFSGFDKGKYIATCPHQLGMVTILRIIYRILGNYRHIGFRMISVFCVGIIVYVGFELVKLLSKGNTYTEVAYLLLSIFCFPMYVYTLFVYGEVPSTAVLFIAAWLLVSCLEKFHWMKVLGIFFSSGLAIQLRQNSLVVLIGFSIILLVKIIQKFHWKQVIMLGAIPAGVIAGNMVIRGIYQEHFQKDAVAIPNILYITMGTNWEEQNPGWFSKYNYNVFFENDCDPEAASEVAKEDLKEFIEYCLNNPDYALKFYEQKFIAQWNEPMYHCLVMNKKIVEQQNPIMESFYFGNLRMFTEAFMNIYQLFVYGAILFWLMMNFKQKQGIEMHILLIGIFGGFLFSLLWEAKTRYIFPYFVMMLPYAALGIERLLSMLHDTLREVYHEIF